MSIHLDLNLKLQQKSGAHMRELLKKSFKLGYDVVGVPFMKNASKIEVQKVRRVCRDIGLDLATRFNLFPKSSRSLLKELRMVRKRAEIIGVQCYSKAVARQAAKDRRVDLISFPDIDWRKRFFDNAEAKLASSSQVSLEIEMAPILYLKGFHRIRLLSFLREEVFVAKKYGVPIVLSSGADHASLLRKPSDFVSLSVLFNLDTQVAKQAISSNPQTIVERNRKKLGSEYIAPGIYSTG